MVLTGMNSLQGQLIQMQILGHSFTVWFENGAA